MASNILIVTSYPEKGLVHSTRTVGVASYTKQLLQGVRHIDDSIQIRVLAERFAEQTNYLEDGIKVDRLWTRGSLLDILRMWIVLIKSGEKVAVMSFEAYMFGSLFLSYIALCLFSSMRLWGKKTVVLMHQVPQELSFVRGVKKCITKVGIKLLKFVLAKVDKVIVFEEALKNRVGKNAEFVPHFVPDLRSTNKSEARKELNIPADKQIMLYFGYIAPYKGLEKLIELWPMAGNSQLIIAGGINPNHKDKQEIREYVNKIMNLAHKKNILTTGFVPEDKIPFYFSATDSVILPYVEFMSSSGPLSLAWAYNLPVIMSDNLREYIESGDFREAFEKSALKTEDLFYINSTAALSRVVNMTEVKRENFEIFGEEMRQCRSLEKVSEKLSNILWVKQ